MNIKYKFQRKTTLLSARRKKKKKQNIGIRDTVNNIFNEASSTYLKKRKRKKSVATNLPRLFLKVDDLVDARSRFFFSLLFFAIKKTSLDTHKHVKHCFFRLHWVNKRNRKEHTQNMRWNRTT